MIRDWIIYAAFFLSGVLASGYVHVVWALQDTRAQLAQERQHGTVRQQVVELLGDTLKTVEPSREKRGEAAAKVMERRGGKQ